MDIEHAVWHDVIHAHKEYAFHEEALQHLIVVIGDNNTKLCFILKVNQRKLHCIPFAWKYDFDLQTVWWDLCRTNYFLEEILLRSYFKILHGVLKYITKQTMFYFDVQLNYIFDQSAWEFIVTHGLVMGNINIKLNSKPLCGIIYA